jgi:hypothetical protein
VFKFNFGLNVVIGRYPLVRTSSHASMDPLVYVFAIGPM